MHDCDAMAELAPAWALGALDRDERSAVHEHLARCRGSHPSLRDALAVAAAIGAALPRRDRPSATGRARLLEAVRRDRGTPDSGRTRVDG